MAWHHIHSFVSGVCKKMKPWHIQILLAIGSFGFVSVSIFAQTTAASINHFFWAADGISLGILMLGGWRMLPGLLVGHLGAFLWLFPLDGAFFYMGISTLNNALSYGLVCRFWPAKRAFFPSTRFFATLIVAGALIPAAVTAPMAWYFREQYNYPGIDFGAGVAEWWMGDCIGVVVFTPLILLFRASFRENGWRSVQSMFLAFFQIGVCVCIGGLVMAGDDPHPVMAIALLIVLGCVIAFRCGVIGLIISNLIQFLVAMALHKGFTRGPEDLIASFNIEFDAIMFEATAIGLLVAGGFYDYWRADWERHDVSARVFKAQEAERRRLSANLHDGVSQTIFSIIMRLRHAAVESESLATPISKSDAKTMAHDLDDALVDLRRTISGLRPEMFDHATLAEVVAEHCSIVEERSGVGILFSDETDNAAEQLTVEVREHLFRLIQEAIANAINHAKASFIEVIFRPHPAKTKLFQIRVLDDGQGFDPARLETTKDRLHLGLHTMEERAFLIGGDLQIDSHLGRGTLVMANIPLHRAKPNNQDEAVVS